MPNGTPHPPNDYVPREKRQSQSSPVLTLKCPSTKPPRLVLTARSEDSSIELEFVTVSDETSIEDRLAYLDEEAETFDESDVALRLLRHYASSVQHQKYHGVDVVTVRVDSSD